jgi:hypothetical protein
MIRNALVIEFVLLFKLFLEQPQGRACSKWRQHFPNKSHTCWAREFHLEHASRRPWHQKRPNANNRQHSVRTNRRHIVVHKQNRDDGPRLFCQVSFYSPIIFGSRQHPSLDNDNKIPIHKFAHTCHIRFDWDGQCRHCVFGTNDKNRGFVLQRHHD